jgi:uncharacterized metal-binding protein
MASGAVHAEDSKNLAYVGGLTSMVISYLTVTQNPIEAMLLGIAFLGGSLSGILLSPDLDIDGKTYAEQDPLFGSLWYIIWWPYGKLISHRSFFSHFPIIGTFGRQLYLVLLLWAIKTVVFPEVIVEFDYTLLQNYTGFVVSFYTGLIMADFVHYLRDSGPYKMTKKQLAKKDKAEVAQRIMKVLNDEE